MNKTEAVDQLVRKYLEKKELTLAINALELDPSNDSLNELLMQKCIDHGIPDHAVKLSRIRKCELTIEEKDRILNQCILLKKIGDAMYLANLGISKKSLNKLANTLINKNEIENALKISELGISTSMLNKLTLKCLSEGYLDYAMHLAEKGVDSKILDKLLFKYAKNGLVDYTLHISKLQEKGLPIYEKEVLIQSYLKNNDLEHIAGDIRPGSHKKLVEKIIQFYLKKSMLSKAIMMAKLNNRTLSVCEINTLANRLK